jgi:hypothetical protein
MGLHRSQGDVGLLRESISMVREFGLHSVDHLLHVAEFLEKSVYGPHSLHSLPGGAGFTLLNPPLRVGAFSTIRVAWDGKFVPPEQAFVRAQGHAVERSVADITPLRPIEMRPGQRIDFRLSGVPTGPGHHRVRIEFQNIAIPPLVWFEFVDSVAERPPT